MIRGGGFNFGINDGFVFDFFQFLAKLVDQRFNTAFLSKKKQGNSLFITKKIVSRKDYPIEAELKLPDQKLT